MAALAALLVAWPVVWLRWRTRHTVSVAEAKRAIAAELAAGASLDEIRAFLERHGWADKVGFNETRNAFEARLSNQGRGLLHVIDLYFRFYLDEHGRLVRAEVQKLYIGL